MPTARQVAAAAAVGRAFRAGGQPGTPSMSERLRLMPAMLVDSWAGRFPGLSRSRLVLLLLGVLYVVSPVDLLPESALLLFGLTDDVLVTGLVVATTLDKAAEYAAWRVAVPYPIRSDK